MSRRWGIQDLLDACRAFPVGTRRRITFEYVLLGELNDTEEDARRLVSLLRGFRCRVNLIPFNPHPLSPYQPPDPSAVRAFQQILYAAEIPVYVRSTRGQDIDAACGMLGAKKLEDARAAQK